MTALIHILRGLAGPLLAVPLITVWLPCMVLGAVAEALLPIIVRLLEDEEEVPHDQP